MNKTPCKRVNKGELDKTALEVLHMRKMALKKAAITYEYNTNRYKCHYRLEANLSKKHPNYGKHPKEAY